MGGKVVHARRGDRTRYAPLRSTLCVNSQPPDVAAALLDLFPFPILYIADIDSIQGVGNNRDVIAQLHRIFSNITLWVDSGISSLAEFNSWQQLNLGRAVIGTENSPKPELVSILASHNAILSLDYRGNDFIGPSNLREQTVFWPSDLIVMTLARVGSKLGPDFERLAQIKKMGANKNIYAAGGVRRPADLEALENLGVTGVLLASALHEGRITQAELRRFI